MVYSDDIWGGANNEKEHLINILEKQKEKLESKLDDLANEEDEEARFRWQHVRDKYTRADREISSIRTDVDLEALNLGFKDDKKLDTLDKISSRTIANTKTTTTEGNRTVIQEITNEDTEKMLEKVIDANTVDTSYEKIYTKEDTINKIASDRMRLYEESQKEIDEAYDNIGRRRMSILKQIIEIDKMISELQQGRYPDDIDTVLGETNNIEEESIVETNHKNEKEVVNEEAEEAQVLSTKTEKTEQESKTKKNTEQDREKNNQNEVKEETDMNQEEIEEGDEKTEVDKLEELEQVEDTEIKTEELDLNGEETENIVEEAKINDEIENIESQQLLDSAVEATEEVAIESVVNQQAQTLENVDIEKSQQIDLSDGDIDI